MSCGGAIIVSCGFLFFVFCLYLSFGMGMSQWGAIAGCGYGGGDWFLFFYFWDMWVKRETLLWSERGGEKERESVQN